MEVIVVRCARGGGLENSGVQHEVPGLIHQEAPHPNARYGEVQTLQGRRISQRFLSFLRDVLQKVWENSVFSRFSRHFVQSSQKMHQALVESIENGGRVHYFNSWSKIHKLGCVMKTKVVFLEIRLLASTIGNRKIYSQLSRDRNKPDHPQNEMKENWMYSRAMTWH